MNVSIFSQEFDESLKTIEAAACCAKYSLDHLVIFVGLFDLSFVVLEDNSNKLN